MLDLKYTETTSIVTIDGKKISLPFIATDPLPVAGIPSYIQVARNTSVQVPENFAATRIYQTLKLAPGHQTYLDGQAVLDASTIKPQKLKIQPVQFAPSQIADKIIVKEMDMASPNMESALSSAVTSWLYQQRCTLETAIINALIKSAKNTQDKIEATPDGKDAKYLGIGAHYEMRAEYPDPEHALVTFRSAVNTLTTIGLERARTEYDRKNLFVNGIKKQDLLCICSDDFLATLAWQPGIVTSPQGYSDVFINMSLQKVLGVDVLPVSNLPYGVHFVLIVTGPYGSFAYNSAVQGAKIDIGDSPDWKGDKIAYLSYSYIAGVVNESLIVAFVDSNYKLPSGDGVIPALSSVTGRAPQSFVEVEKNVGSTKTPPQTYKIPEDYRKENESKKK